MRILSKLHRPTHARACTGFTLLEMTIVVAIISIIAVGAQLRFASSLTEHRLDALARQIVKDIDIARQAARATSATKTISIDKTSNCYTLIGVTNPDHRSKLFLISLATYAPNASFGTVSLGGDTNLIFNGFGLPDSGGTIQIKIAGLTRTISVDSTTGGASVL